MNPAVELRLSLRSLRRAPIFTLTTLLILAVGIGATTAIFTLVYNVLLKPLPYAEAHRLVVIEERAAEFQSMFPTLPASANHFEDWQRNARGFEAMAAMEMRTWPMGTGAQPVQVSVLQSTAGIFPTLRAVPALGRIFTAQDDQPGHERVVVLLDSLWRSQFNADPQIVGRTVQLNGYAYQVIGVMPRGFYLPALHGVIVGSSAQIAPQAMVPMAFNAETLAERMGDFNYVALARLRGNVTGPAAQAELDSLQHGISATLPADSYATLSSAVTPLQTKLVGDNRKPMLILLAAVAGLLLVGCANIANLLLARALGRRRELAITAALGAGRGALIMASLREIFPLAAGGCLLGLLLAAWMIPFLQHYLPPSLDFRGPLHLDAAGAGCAVLAATVSMVFAGLIPALIGLRQSPQQALRSESRSSSESRASKQLRATLVVLEVATSVALVLVAGLLTTSLMRLMHVERGFASEQVFSAKLRLPYNAYRSMESRETFYRTVQQNIAQMPGVSAAGITSCIPLLEDEWVSMVRLPGDTRSIMQQPAEHLRWVSPGYVETLRLPLMEGRRLTESDEGKNLAMISALTARTLWPGQSAIGRQFHRSDMDQPTTVIGVLGDARTITLAKPDPMMIYVPYWTRANSSAAVLVRTTMPAAALTEALHRTVWKIDSSVAIPTVRPLSGVAEDSAAASRFAMDLLLVFAIAASILAALGIYGVVAYSVAQREREIGLRVAVGARPRDIMTMVLGQGLRPVLMGIVLGVLAAFASGRLLASLLYNTSPYSPPVTLATVAMLFVLGVVACGIPALRIATIDPVRVLREQ